jgi:hypothetical protein
VASTNGCLMRGRFGLRPPRAPLGNVIFLPHDLPAQIKPSPILVSITTRGQKNYRQEDWGARSGGRRFAGITPVGNNTPRQAGAVCCRRVTYPNE